MAYSQFGMNKLCGLVQAASSGQDECIRPRLVSPLAAHNNHDNSSGQILASSGTSPLERDTWPNESSFGGPAEEEEQQRVRSLDLD